MVNIYAFVCLSCALCHTLTLYCSNNPRPHSHPCFTKICDRGTNRWAEEVLNGSDNDLCEREDPQREATEELTAVSHKVRCSNLISQIDKNAYNGNGRILYLSEWRQWSFRSSSVDRLNKWLFQVFWLLELYLKSKARLDVCAVRKHVKGGNVSSLDDPHRSMNKYDLDKEKARGFAFLLSNFFRQRGYWGKMWAYKNIIHHILPDNKMAGW